MKILAIGGSNSKNSINRALAAYTANLFHDAEVSLVDVSQIEIPLYSIDCENESGIPQAVADFAVQMDETDLIVISLAENNGSFNVGLKNLLDWASRIKDRTTFNHKPMLLMATSPGPRGGATVLESAKLIFAYSTAEILATFSLPDFYQNFSFEKGIINEQLLSDLKNTVAKVASTLK